jgi:hypothetical protein
MAAAPGEPSYDGHLLPYPPSLETPSA